MANKKTETVTENKSSRAAAAPAKNGVQNGVVAVAAATVAPGIDAKDSVYDAISKDLAAIGASDAQAKKIGSSPLGEGRGQDVVRLHATLRAADLLNGKLNRVFVSLQTALSEVDDHLHSDAATLTTQAERNAKHLLSSLSQAASDLDAAVKSAKSSLSDQLSKAQSALSDQVSKTQGALSDLASKNHSSITKTTEKAESALSDQLTKSTSSLTKTVKDAESALSEQVAEAQTALSGEIGESLADLQGRTTTVLETLKDSFTKLSRATAGSEENLKAQTNSFSSAVEELLTNVQNTLQKQTFEFREELTRQVDKRMNQADVAFAAVRADQEVIKALLTDIIKDRMGRAEPKYR